MALVVEKSYYDSNWEEEYNRKVVPVQEALKIIKSGDLVIVPFFPPSREALPKILNLPTTIPLPRDGYSVFSIPGQGD